MKSSLDVITDKSDESLHVYDQLMQLLDNVFSNLVAYVTSEEKDFSVKQMKNMLTSFELQFISGEIETRAMKLISGLKDKDADRKGFSKEIEGAHSTNSEEASLANPKQSSLDSGWIQELLKMKNVQ